MSLKDKLMKGKQPKPPRICIYGTHGIGKSTLASQFPKPVFISTEDGLSTLDVISFPMAENINDVVTNIKDLIAEDHDFKTVVIDTADWLVEPLITKNVEDNHSEKELSYGKGAIMIAEEFREILQGLDYLRNDKDMNVVILAHADVKRFDDPRSDSYERYICKLPQRCNNLLMEWVDVLAFAAFRLIVKDSDIGFNNTRSRGVSTGERLLHYVENPAYLAKNRYGCPNDSPMTFEDISKLIPIKGA